MSDDDVNGLTTHYKGRPRWMSRLEAYQCVFTWKHRCRMLLVSERTSRLPACNNNNNHANNNDDDDE